jgi:hypothetical protein
MKTWFFRYEFRMQNTILPKTLRIESTSKALIQGNFKNEMP